MLLPPIKLDINTKGVANSEHFAEPIAEHRRRFAFFLIGVLFPLGRNRHFKIAICFGMRGTSFLLAPIELSLNGAQCTCLSVSGGQLSKHFELEAFDWQFIV